MPRILVIDDEPGIRGLLAAILERKGYQVLLAENGRKGLALFRRERPDVVVLDLKMPEMDGRTVLKALHTLHPGLPVVILTGIGTEETEQQVRALGAAACIGKEFSLHRLGDTLKHLLPLPADPPEASRFP